MSARQPAPASAHAASRKAQNRAAQESADRRSRRIRAVAYGAIVIAVLGLGLYLAGGVFLGQHDRTTVANALPVRLSMAGFDPKVITAKAGATVSLDFWNTDNAMHLDGGGVHTFIMDDQHIYVKIPPRPGGPSRSPPRPRRVTTISTAPLAAAARIRPGCTALCASSRPDGRLPSGRA